MAFNTSAFMKAEFVARTAEVRVDGLADWFDGEPLWIVRGQTADEVARAMEASTRNKSLEAVIAAIGSNADKISEIRQAIGLPDAGVHGEIVRRIAQLATCSVEPAIDENLAVKLAETRPIEFYLLTNKIVELTGLGMDVKKRKPSGQTPASETS